MRVSILGALPAVLWAAEITRANPFVTMSAAVRYAVVVYIVLWRILPNFAAALQLEQSVDRVLVYGRLATSTVLDVLLLLPVLFRQYAGTPIGWLHPLVLPTLIIVVKDLILSPESLLMPILAWFQPPAIPDYELLRGMPIADKLTVELKRDLVLIAAQLSYLAGFALYARRPSTIKIGPNGGVSGWRIGALIAASFAVFAYFIHTSGGLATHFAKLTLGRYQMREASGHFLVVIGLLPYWLLLWYAHRPEMLRRPWFIVLFATATAAQFAATGSRSNTFLPVVMLLALWVWIHGRLPVVRLALLAVIALFAIGTLGDWRSGAVSLRDGGAVTSVATLDLADAARRTREEVAEREAVSGQIAIFQKVPEDVPHLYGVTYISAAAFFVPRSLWPEKPRGAGAHVAAMIFEGWPSTVGYQGQAFPATGIGEAYWNFGIAGVIFVFALFGIFFRLLTQKFLEQPRDPFVATVMLLAVVTLGDVDSDSLVGFLQRVVLLYLAYRLVRTRDLLGDFRTV